MFHKIKSVTPLANYRLLVPFTEGCCREYDMTPLIQRMPVFAPLRDVPGLFGQEGVDAQKYGKQWIVTRNAMEREYGPAPQR